MEIDTQVVASESGESDAREGNAENLIGRKMSINDLMNLWDEGWGIAVHVDMDDESPFIVEKKSDFFDIGAELFECFHADDSDGDDEKFIEVVVI